MASHETDHGPVDPIDYCIQLGQMKDSEWTAFKRCCCALAKNAKRKDGFFKAMEAQEESLRSGMSIFASIENEIFDIVSRIVNQYDPYEF